MADPDQIPDQINEFLTSRRAKVTPDDVGLPIAAGNRRVPGLRREEVAVLANISLEYYIRIERGTATGVSETILDAVASALQLSEAERTHLFDLMRADRRTTPRRRSTPNRRVRAPVVHLLDGMPRTPAVVHDHRLDILTTNILGRALFDPLYADPVRPASYARFLFLDHHAHDYWIDWDDAADNTVAILREPGLELQVGLVGRDLLDKLGEMGQRWDRTGLGGPRPERRPRPSSRPV